MKKTNLFSGVKPATEDWNYERDAKELHVKKRIIDLTGTGTGILKNIDDELEVYIVDPNQFLIAKTKTGEAYIQGEKIEIASIQDVSLDSVETEANIIYLTYELKDSSDPKAIRHHYLTGEEHNVWQEDSFELTAVKESLYVQTNDKLKLARVAKVGGLLVVTHDYRTYLRISDDIMNTLIEGQEILFKQPAPAKPIHLRCSTGLEDEIRKNEIAGLISMRPAYIKVEFGDYGTGTASGNLFTKVSSQVTWLTNEWANHYLTDANDNSWKVVSNTATVLTLETGSTPVSGSFILGPDAKGYRYFVEIIDQDTSEIISYSQVEMTRSASPTKMEYIITSLTPDVKYRIRVASLGGWYQDEQSELSDYYDIIAGGAKEIPDDCADAVQNVVAIAHDLGLKINWDVVPAHTDHVAGIELAWTDDGSTPDFANVGHRKLFTDRNYAILPVQLSTTEIAVTVKALMRCVDKAGRHCVTPLTIAPVAMKQYPGDLAAVAARMQQVQIAARGYSSLDERLQAITLSAIGLGYTRWVAKFGGQYTQIQAAIDSIQDTDKYYIIFVMPGKYIGNITIGNKLVGIIGLGKVLIEGSIDCGQGGYLLDNLRIKTTSSNIYAISKLTPALSTQRFFMRDCIIDGSTIGSASYVVRIDTNFVMFNCLIKTSNAGDPGLYISPDGALTGTIKNNCRFDTQTYCIQINGASAIITVDDCHLKSAGSAQCIEVTAGTLRIYNSVWKVVPAGAGTIDYGTPDPASSNVQNDNIEILLEDDMLSNET